MASARIAPLELLQSLVCVLAFTDAYVGQDSMLEVAGITDNRGNSFVVAKMLTTKWPLAAILAELGWQLQKRGLLLRLHWRPRELNDAADRLSNGDFSGIDPAKRVEISKELLAGEILPELLEAGASWLREATRLRERKIQLDDGNGRRQNDSLCQLGHRSEAPHQTARCRPSQESA